jgi:hypothetical protein
MQQLHPPLVRYLVLLLVAATAGAALGQGLGPDAYGVPCSFGSATPTSPRQLALGAVIASMNDVQSANPAFAPLHEVANAGARVNWTDFDAGPRLRSLQLHWAQPLRPGRSGFQVSWVDLRTYNGGMTMPGPQPVPVTVDMSERALVVDYGRRVGAKSTAGLSVLGFQNADFSLTPPVGPRLLDLHAKADFGGQFGAAYEYQPGDFLGILYSFSQHTVDASGLMMGGVAGSPVFHDDLLTVGMSYHPTPRLLAVGEFQHGGTARGPLLDTTNSLHLGAEYLLTPGVAVRIGQADGRLTYGAGVTARRWRLDYAHIQDWNDSAVHQLFGGSDTDSLQVTCHW